VRRGIPVGVFVGLGIAAALACNSDTDDNQWREDVLSCEEAVAHLDECCPGFDLKRVQCRYYYHIDRGCGTDTVTHVEPDIELSDSHCIRDSNCDKLQSQGNCDPANYSAKPDGGRARGVLCF